MKLDRLPLQVVCIDDEGSCGGLVEGETYTIVGAADGNSTAEIQRSDGKFLGGWFLSRFQEINETKQETRIDLVIIRGIQSEATQKNLLGALEYQYGGGHFYAHPDTTDEGFPICVSESIGNQCEQARGFCLGFLKALP